MNNYRVTFRQTARSDLQSIFNYVLERSRSRESALRYIRRIRTRCERIAHAPFASVSRPELGDNIRMAVFERSIVILYLVDGDRVRITNIFSGGRDYETLLRNQPLLP